MTTTSTEATVIPVPATTDDAKLQPVLLTLQYCLETFEQNCQCGRCDPCTQGREDISQSIKDVHALIHSRSPDSPAHLELLPDWDAKIADLFNHGLNDEEISDYSLRNRLATSLATTAPYCGKGLKERKTSPRRRSAPK